MNLMSLKGFATVVELGSINAAAKQLGISQPALSKSLKSLEAKYAVPLLIRRRAGAIPTEFGRALFEHARVVVAEVTKAEQNILQMRDRFEGTISLAASPAPTVELIPRALKQFRHDFPDIIISIREAVFPRVGQQLADGTVDIAIGPTATIPNDSSYKVIPLMDFPLDVVAARSNPQKDETDLSNLANTDWLQIGGIGAASALIRETFLKHNIIPPIAKVESYSVTCAITLLQSSDMVSILPRNLIQRGGLGNDLVSLPIKEDIAQNPCGIVFDVSRPSSRVTQIFSRYLEKAAVQMTHN